MSLVTIEKQKRRQEMKTKSILITGIAIVLASCAPRSISMPTETSTKAKPTEVITSKVDQVTAIEVARKSCVSSGATQIEKPQESQAALMSLTDGYRKMQEGTIIYSISVDLEHIVEGRQVVI